MLVMDENRHLGDTYFPKAVDATPFADLSDVKAMVLQHRSHPSIIMWSLCNEESQGTKPYGAKMFAAMKAAVKRIDPTRPTTGGINGGYTKEGYISVEEILGMNYHNAEFGKIHAEFPGLMIYGSEDTNAKSSRGTLETSRATGLCSAYSDGPTPETSGGQPWNSWGPVMENAFVAGEFVWTGFDYRGEPRSEERRVGKEGRYRRDWSSDVCSSDLGDLRRAALELMGPRDGKRLRGRRVRVDRIRLSRRAQIGRASRRERG